MTHRILFLDIDGVILPTRMWAAPGNIDLLEIEPSVRAPQVIFDPGAIGLLNRIAQRSGAKFVLHSNWRRTWPGERASLQDRLVCSGLAQENWHAFWAVPTCESKDKAQEISAWLLEHGQGVRQCLIVDDAPITTVSAPGSVEIAQLRPTKDEGMGMREYRAALKFFGISDGRTRRNPSAALWVSAPQGVSKTR